MPSLLPRSRRAVGGRVEQHRRQPLAPTCCCRNITCRAAARCASAAAKRSLHKAHSVTGLHIRKAIHTDAQHPLPLAHLPLPLLPSPRFFTCVPPGHFAPPSRPCRRARQSFSGSVVVCGFGTPPRPARSPFGATFRRLCRPPNAPAARRSTTRRHSRRVFLSHRRQRAFSLRTLTMALPLACTSRRPAALAAAPASRAAGAQRPPGDATIAVLADSLCCWLGAATHVPLSPCLAGSCHWPLLHWRRPLCWEGAATLCTRCRAAAGHAAHGPPLKRGLQPCCLWAIRRAQRRSSAPARAYASLRTTDMCFAGAVPSLCRGASNASRRGNTAAGVGQVRERGGAARALQSEREGTVRSDSGASNSGCPLDFKQMDWELWHYKPFSYWFLRPGFVVSCGVG